MSKLQITPIGTCRIHTPLKRAAMRYPIELNLARNYGYVHTSAEALQQLCFLAGEKQFAPEVMPLVFGDPGRAESAMTESWSPSDLQIIEISSAKSIQSGEDFVQVNYLSRHYADLFADEERIRKYWSLVRRAHRGELVDFLKDVRAFGALPPADRDLLLGLRVEQQTFKSVKSDMQEIVERLGRDKVMFVTHVNALTPDESIIPSRDRLIRWVKLAAEQLGAPVFDPTPAMLEFGQEQALEKGGLDVTHYTSAFFDKIYDEMHRSHVGAQLRSKAGGDEGAGDEAPMAPLAAQFEVMLDMGDFFSTSRDVHAAIEQAADPAALLPVRGLIRSRIGDYSGAVADFSAIEDDASLSQPVRLALLKAMVATGSHKRALEVAERLLADEFASAEIYLAASIAAGHSGDEATAARYAKQAFRSDHDDLTAALHALKLLSRTGNDDEIEDWRREVLANAGGSSAGAFEICVWAIEHRDEPMFAAGLRSVAARDKGGTVDLVEDALAAGMFDAVAQSVPLLVAIGRVPRSLAERRSALLQTLLDEARQMVINGSSDLAFRIARALTEMEGASNSQIAIRSLVAQGRRVLRDVLVDVRSSVREAYRSHDFAKVCGIYDSRAEIIVEDADVATIVARSLQASGREREALSLILRVQARSPESFAPTRWAARLAALAKNYTVALRMYGLLRTDFSEQAKPISSEVDRFFAIAERVAVRQLRELIADERFEDASELANIMLVELNQPDRVERELGRMVRALRIKLKGIDEGDGDIDEREAVLRQLVTLRPEDETLLRRLALELMRQFRFLEAAEIWDRIVRINPENESAERNLERCRRLAASRAPSVVADADGSG